MTIAMRDRRKEKGPVIRQLRKIMHKFSEDQVNSIYESNIRN
jgi:hypothetical protein